MPSQTLSREDNQVLLTTESLAPLRQYLANLSPELAQKQIDDGAAQYTNRGAPIDQTKAIMGECEFKLLS